MIKLSKARLAAGAASFALAAGGVAVMGASTAGATTVTCSSCVHVQNVYAFRGAIDALGQATAVNSPIGLWYEKPSTTDPGADFLQVPAGTVTTNVLGHGVVNQSHLNWSQYAGDSVIRLKYDPYGNGGANTYLGLEGPGQPTKVALRADNPNSIWQELIKVPVTKDGAAASATTSPAYYVLVDVGQTVNPNDPVVVTDPGNAFTGSGVQLDVEPEIVNQAGDVATNQIWDTQSSSGYGLVR